MLPGVAASRIEKRPVPFPPRLKVDVGSLHIGDLSGIAGRQVLEVQGPFHRVEVIESLDPALYPKAGALVRPEERPLSLAILQGDRRRLGESPFFQEKIRRHSVIVEGERRRCSFREMPLDPFVAGLILRGHYH